MDNSSNGSPGLRTAVVGAGPQGKRTIDAVRELQGLELSSVVDLNEQALASLSLPETARRFTSLESAAADQTLDVVCIATNGPSHRVLTEQAVKLGVRYIMVEKPMACSVEDCEAMIELCREHGVRLAVNQSRRHDPLYRWISEQIRCGRWGEVRTIWIQRPGIGLGCLAIHSFDLATFLADSEVVEVSAWVDDFIGPNPRGDYFVDPGGLVVGILKNGARMTVAQIEDGAGPMSVEVNLTGARLRIDEKGDDVEIIVRDRSVIPGPGRPPVFERCSLPGGLSAKTNMGVMLKGVIQELVGNDKMVCDGQFGKAAVDVLVGAYVSHRSGHRPVSLTQLNAEDRAMRLPVT